MNLFPVFTFIIQHYLQARVHNVVIFNCWDMHSQLIFLRNANDHLLRTKMVDINKDIQFPGEHLDGVFTVLGIFLDVNCKMAGSILNKSSDSRLFVAQYNWLIIDEVHSYLELEEQFEHTMMSVNAEITYAMLDNVHSRHSDVSFVLYDVYNNGKHLGGKLNITLDRKVTCDRKNCVTKYLSDLRLRTKYGNRCNLNDTTFRISTVITSVAINSPPEILQEFLRSVNNSQTDTISRYGFKLVIILQDIMNYKVKYLYTDAWSYNETGGASIGDVSNGNAELSSSGFFPALARLRHVDFILQIGDFRSVFLFRTPRNEGLYGSAFLMPFSPPVWIAFGVVIIGCAFLLWAIFAIEFRIVKYVMFIPSLLSAFLISFGLACVQGAALIPHTTGGRMAFLSLSLVTFIMYNYYTSTVVSSLIGSPVKSNIKTVEQLADSRLDIGIDPAAYTVAYLKVATTPDVKKLVRKKLNGRLDENSTLWLSAEDGILRARHGGFAYHSEASTVYRFVEKYYKQHELCDLNEIKLRPESSLVSIMGKKSTYKEIVRINMIRMLESGVISKHRRFWMKTKLNCFSKTVMINVGLEYTGPLFVFLASVYILTIIVLILEIIYHKYFIA